MAVLNNQEILVTIAVEVTVSDDFYIKMFSVLFLTIK